MALWKKWVGRAKGNEVYNLLGWPKNNSNNTCFSTELPVQVPEIKLKVRESQSYHKRKQYLQEKSAAINLILCGSKNDSF